MKKIICIVLAAVMCLSLTACGGSGYKSVKTLRDTEYSIGFRNGDSIYYYIEAAIKELNSEGVVGDLSAKWFGKSGAVDFPRGRNALDDISYIPERDFIIGVDLSSYPLCFADGDGYSGFDVELAQAVCEKLGWTLKVQPIESADAYVELNSGNIDCAWGGVTLDEESPDYTIFCTYMSDELVIAGKRNGASSLHGNTLYIGTGELYMELLEENPRLQEKLGQITRVQGDASTLFEYLDSGDCDFIIATASAVKYKNNH